MRQRLFLAILCLTMVQAKCSDMDKALRAYGYTPIKPPSKLLQVGSLVWLSEKDPMVAGVICSSDKTMGADWVPSESPTMNTALARTARKGVNFKIAVDAFASGSIEAETIKDVSLSIKNSRLYDLADFDVQERGNITDDRCLRALQRRKRAGFLAEIVSSALVGDATYHVRWVENSNLTVQAKIAQLEMVSAQLGLGASTVTDKTISAEGLILAIKTDPFLTYLYSPANLERTDRRRSGVPEKWDGYFSDKEDASSTTSHGDEPTLASEREEEAYWQDLEFEQEPS